MIAQGCDDSQAGNTLLPSLALPPVCPACGDAHSGDSTYKRLAWAAHQRGTQLGALPVGCVAPHDPVFKLTLFRGGMTASRGGMVHTFTLAGFEAYAKRYSGQNVIRKGDPHRGTTYVDGVTNGGRRDSDVLAVSSRTFDCDGVPGHDWHPLLDVVRAAGLGAVLKRSSSHTPELAKWHALVPFHSPLLVGTLGATPEEDAEEWRRRDTWLCGIFSGLAATPGVGKREGKTTPACGFDLKSKTFRGHVVAFTARRTHRQAMPEVVHVAGGGLDLSAFLDLTGYHEARATFLAARPQVVGARPARAAGVVGDAGATLEAVPEELRAAVDACARDVAPAFADPSRNRQHLFLAVGGLLGRWGVAEGVAHGIGRVLAAAAGLPVEEKARAVRDSCRERLGQTRNTYGESFLLRQLGPEVVDRLNALRVTLAPQPLRLPAPVTCEVHHVVPAPVERPRVVSREEHAAWLRAALTAEASDGVGRVSLDRSPTGNGKTGTLARVVAQLYAGGPGEPPVVLCFDRHDLADDFLRELRSAEAELGQGTVNVAKVPQLETVRCAPGVGREALYRDAAARGFNPVTAVCGACPSRPARKRADDGTRLPVIPLAPLCTFRCDAEDAWQAQVVLATKHHMALPGFFDGLGSRFRRLVIEEDAADVLAVPCAVDRQALRGFVQLLQRAELQLQRAADHDAKHAARAAERAAMREKFTPDLTRLAAVRQAADALLPLLRREAGALQVALPADVVAALAAMGGDERHRVERLLLQRYRDEDEDEHDSSASDSSDDDAAAPRNLLPLLWRLVDAGEAGAAGVLERTKRGRMQLHVDLPRPVPRNRTVLLLDATGDEALLRAELGREVHVLRAAPRAEVQLVQVVGSLWSRKRLSDAAKVEEAAALVAELILRTGATDAPAVVSYKPLVASAEDGGHEALRLAVQRRLHAAGVVAPQLKVGWFGALRGSNALKGCSVLVVIGTPNVGAAAVQLRALRLGATLQDVAERQALLDVAPGWRTQGYAGELMRRAHAGLVAAELAQAVGRGARGDVVPPGGVWLVSSLPCDRWAAVEPQRYHARALALDPEALAAWPVLTALQREAEVAGDAGLVTEAELARRLAVLPAVGAAAADACAAAGRGPRFLARRLLAAAAEWRKSLARNSVDLCDLTHSNERNNAVVRTPSVCVSKVVEPRRYPNGSGHFDSTAPNAPDVSHLAPATVAPAAGRPATLRPLWSAWADRHGSLPGWLRAAAQETQRRLLDGPAASATAARLAAALAVQDDAEEAGALGDAGARLAELQAVGAELGGAGPELHEVLRLAAVAAA